MLAEVVFHCNHRDARTGNQTDAVLLEHFQFKCIHIRKRRNSWRTP
jgi:hypothetical protein